MPARHDHQSAGRLGITPRQRPTGFVLVISRSTNNKNLHHKIQQNYSTAQQDNNNKNRHLVGRAKTLSIVPTKYQYVNGSDSVF